VAFKIRQNPLPAGALPRTPAEGAHDGLPNPHVGWGGDTSFHTLPRSAPTHIQRSPCVPQNSSQIYDYAYALLEHECPKTKNIQQWHTSHTTDITFSFGRWRRVTSMRVELAAKDIVIAIVIVIVTFVLIC